MSGRRHHIGTVRKSAVQTYHVDLVERPPSSRIELTLWSEGEGKITRPTPLVYRIRIHAADAIAELIHEGAELARAKGLGP